MRANRQLTVLNIFSLLTKLQFFGAVAVPFYLHRVGLDYTGMFILEAVFSFSLLVSEVPTGVIADRFGRKISLSIGSLLFGLSFLIFGLCANYAVLLAAEVIGAVGMSLLSGADRALLYDVLRESGKEADAAKIIARNEAFGTMGMFIAMPAGSLFVGSGLVPYTAALGIVFVATAISLILGSILIMGVREPERRPSTASAIQKGIEGFRAIFRNPSLMRFSLNYAVISSLTFFMFWFYQSLLMRNGFPVALQGFVAAAFNLGATLLLMVSGPVNAKLGTGRSLFLSSIIPGLCYVGVFFIPGLAMALIAIFGVTILKIYRAPLLSALMNRHIDSGNRATVLSGVSMLERIITAAFYPIAGIMTDVSLERTFLIMGILTVGLSLFLRVGEDHLKS